MRATVLQRSVLPSVGLYVIVPPSLHTNGKRYAFLNECYPVKMLEWLVKIIREGKSVPNPSLPANGSGGKIREGVRNATLASLAGTIRMRGLAGNGNRCGPS
jgi:hypothetical protein